MRVGGRVIELMDKDDSFTLMETSIMAIGEKIRHINSEFINMLTAPNIKDFGTMISNTAMGKKNGQTDLNTMESILRERNMA